MVGLALLVWRHYRQADAVGTRHTSELESASSLPLRFSSTLSMPQVLRVYKWRVRASVDATKLDKAPRCTLMQAVFRKTT